MLQDPADFDFEMTRAINNPHHRPENTGELDEDKKTATPEVQSVNEVAGLTDDSDLDPVELHKAFKFAAWSSIVLVHILPIYATRFFVLTGMLSPSACHNDHRHSPSAVLRTDDIRCAGPRGVGCHWHHLGVRFLFDGRRLPVMGEPRGPWNGASRSCQGSYTFRLIFPKVLM